MIFLVKNMNYKKTLKKTVLKFTYELNINNKIPFLNVLIDTNNNTFTTST